MEFYTFTITNRSFKNNNMNKNNKAQIIQHTFALVVKWEVVQLGNGLSMQNIREFKMSQPQQQQEFQKSNVSNYQNNDNASASHVLVHFFTATAWLQNVIAQIQIKKNCLYQLKKCNTSDLDLLVGKHMG